MTKSAKSSKKARKTGFITVRAGRTPLPSPEPTASSSPRGENSHEGSPSRRDHLNGDSPRDNEVHKRDPSPSMRSTPPTGPSTEEVMKAMAVCMEFMHTLGERFPSIKKPPSPPPRSNDRKRKSITEGEKRAPSSKGEGSQKAGHPGGSGQDQRRGSGHSKSSKAQTSEGHHDIHNVSRRSVLERLGGKGGVHSCLTFPEGSHPSQSRERTPPASTSLRGRSGVPSAKQKGKAVMVPTSSPFQRWILEEHVPTVKIPAHITYDGTSDPKDHIASYEGHMYLNPRSEATWCKYFPTTLKGVAQSWITKGLKEGSITGWSDLANKFKSKFSTANRREKTTAELMGLQQAEDESLRDYLTRFSNESSRITSLDQSLAVFALRNGLQAGKFLDFMVMHPPQTLEEALDASDKFIRAEEWNKAKLQSQSELVKPKGQQAEVPVSRKGKAKASEPPLTAEPKKDKAPFLGKFESYTPLTLPRTKIFSATREEGRFKKPKPPPSWHQKKGKDLWCEFHESRGHRTEDCLQLKDQIEELVQKGYLKKYVAERREDKKTEKDSRQELDYHRKKGQASEGGHNDILSISGGISRNALKRHLRGLTHQIHHTEFQKP
ncbi:uncharacterized protein LOC110701764 [Chenopodium quinoa]|uniref:uncharacterized protein LOC110701764 n=1 Tax=Chenopodium quinoa TaxID=63459 RepID=UPI000B782CF0|nr:uncharacterized protein LOC110701764 [Chenopodium quinoa]